MFKFVKLVFSKLNAISQLIAAMNRQNKEKNQIYQALGSPRYIGLNQHESTITAIAELRGQASDDTLNQPMIDMIRETLVVATQAKAGLQ